MTIDKFEWTEDQIEITPPTPEELEELEADSVEDDETEPDKSEFQKLIDAFMSLIGK